MFRHIAMTRATPDEVRARLRASTATGLNAYTTSDRDMAEVRRARGSDLALVGDVNVDRFELGALRSYRRPGRAVVEGSIARLDTGSAIDVTYRSVDAGVVVPFALLGAFVGGLVARRLDAAASMLVLLLGVWAAFFVADVLTLRRRLVAVVGGP